MSRGHCRWATYIHAAHHVTERDCSSRQHTLRLHEVAVPTRRVQVSVFVVCMYHENSITTEPCSALCVLSTPNNAALCVVVTNNTAEKRVSVFDRDVYLETKRLGARHV
jgi:hypothetical protein